MERRESSTCRSQDSGPGDIRRDRGTRFDTRLVRPDATNGGQYIQFQSCARTVALFTGFCTLSGSGCTNAWRGTIAGTHTVELTPFPATATGNVTLKAWASSRVTGALTIGTPAVYTSTVPGQAVQFTFNGTAGQQLGLRLSNFTTSVSWNRTSCLCDWAERLPVRQHVISGGGNVGRPARNALASASEQRHLLGAGPSVH